MILLIGSHNDPHLIAIHDRIADQDYQAFILPTDRDSLLKSSFSYHSNQSHFSMPHLGMSDPDRVKAVFFLSPFYMKKGFSSTQEKEFWHFTWRESLYGYYAHLARSAFVINKSIYNALAAQNKISLVHYADIAGLSVPDCLISNSRTEIMEFFDRYDEIILKTMHQIYLEYKNESAMLLVKTVQKKDFAAFEDSGECPVFLQHAINKQFDFRVIIVGEKIFACKIDASRSLYGNVDWRAYDLPNTVHEIYELS